MIGYFDRMRKKRNQAIYGTTALQAEASPESKPSLKRRSPRGS